MKLYITKKAHLKLKYFVALCELEISGFGKVKLLESTDGKGGKDAVMYDLDIFKQEVGPAHSNMDPDSLAKFLYEKTKAKEDLSEWIVWWHSHAKMASFFSSTDTGTINTSTEFPFLISLVTNHAGDIKVRADVFNPIRYTQEDVKVEILEDEDEELKALCQKEIAEKVTISEKKWHGGERQVGYQTGRHGRGLLNLDSPRKVEVNLQDDREEGDAPQTTEEILDAMNDPDFEDRYVWDPRRGMYLPRANSSTGKDKRKYTTRETSQK